MQDRLHPAKAKITKEKVQEKKTELHRNKEGAGGTGVSGDQKEGGGFRQ